MKTIYHFTLSTNLTYTLFLVRLLIINFQYFFYSLGIDPPVSTAKKAAMSSSAIIGIVIGVILLVLILLDITCYFVNRLGVIAICCNSRSKQADEEDPKLGR